jgi:hypothetical protein
VLAAPCGFDRPRHVQVIRQRVVDRVDVGIVEQRLVRAVRPGDAEFLRGLVGARLIARGDGDDLSQAAALHRWNDFVDADGGGTEDPESNGRSVPNRKFPSACHDWFREISRTTDCGR